MLTLCLLLCWQEPNVGGLAQAAAAMMGANNKNITADAEYSQILVSYQTAHKRFLIEERFLERAGDQEKMADRRLIPINGLHSTLLHQDTNLDPAGPRYYLVLRYRASNKVLQFSDSQNQKAYPLLAIRLGAYSHTTVTEIKNLLDRLIKKLKAG